MEECKAMAEEALEAATRNRIELTDDICVVPKGAHCLFIRGKSDPVLEPQYVDAYYSFLKARTTASVEWKMFEKSQHAMAVVEEPWEYKEQHVKRLLQRIPEWKI